MQTRTTLRLLSACFATAALFAAPAKKTPSHAAGAVKEVLWCDPADIAGRNLFYGPGGEARQPRAPFTFLKEDAGGTNPKYQVRDADGVRWTVKLGVEARPETAASRLVWAIGYAANEDYYLPEVRVDNVPGGLKRGRDLVGKDGVMKGARLKRFDERMKKTGNWKWRENPFSGTRELNGLRVLMAVLNNWDVKDVNNAVFETKRPANGFVERIYMASDVGSSFGTTGVGFRPGHSKDNLEAYRRSRFITKTRADHIDLASPSHPSLFSPRNIPYFFMWLNMRWIGKGVPRKDARWVGDLLGRLSKAQVRDAFRASGYSEEETEAFTQVVERRIAALREL